MGEVSRETPKAMVNEEAEAEVEIWNYVFGFVKMGVVKCAIELGIAEAIENNGSPMTISELSTALGCEPSLIQRIMRFLVHFRIFKEEPNTKLCTMSFTQTPLSRRLMRHGQNSMAAFILLESSQVMLAPWLNLSSHVLDQGTFPFDKAHGKDVWQYAVADGAHSKLINDAMADDARFAIPAIVEACPEVFDGIGTLVDVGSGDGTSLGMLVEAFPWIRGINFDLPHVISDAKKFHGVKNVGGDMFDHIPKADAVFIKWVLHDWGDDQCIQILKNCREAIPKDKGKVIIAEAIIEEGEGDKFKFVTLMLDMVMMAHTRKGKERTLKEWDYLLQQAGYSRYIIKSTGAVQSLIVAFPQVC